ncbi:hypothetical protein DMUE_5135 [Dictyocoela muelleri]|nr:hypothetical protein DMUE_5135 [Dictyocoela muelleri]
MVNTVLSNQELIITEWKKSKTKKEPQRLLCKINWYRKFIPNLSSKFTNLYSKSSTNSYKVSITDNEMLPIFDIYKYIKQRNYLYISDLNSDFFIHTDAS